MEAIDIPKPYPEKFRHDVVAHARRGGGARSNCVRVAPAQSTPIEYVDRLAAALPEVVGRFGK